MQHPKYFFLSTNTSEPREWWNILNTFTPIWTSLLWREPQAVNVTMHIRSWYTSPISSCNTVAPMELEKKKKENEKKWVQSSSDAQKVSATYKHWHSSSGQVGGYFRQFSMHHPSLTVAFPRAIHTWDLTTRSLFLASDSVLINDFWSSPVFLTLWLGGDTGVRPEGPKPPVLVRILISAQFTNVSWLPQPTDSVPLLQVPQVLRAK